MNVKESIEQLKSLIEHFNNSGNDFNATDIEAIKFLLKENQELNKKYLNAVADYETTMAEKEQLKKQVEEYKEQVNKGLYNVCLPYQTGYNKAIKDKENQQKEFISYLENEKDRLARECSQIYEDSLGKTKLVNEDIYNEVDKILSKYKEIIGDDK